MRKTLPPIFGILMAGLLSSATFAATFTATLDRDSITMGETATLTLKIEGGRPSAISAAPNIPNLELAGPSTSQSINMINGQTTVSVSQTFVINPLKPGEYVIPPFTAVVDGQRLQSGAPRLKVGLTDPTAPPPEYGDKLAFLWLMLPKTEAFLGEPVIAELRLYVRGDVQKISDFSVPAIGGSDFTSGNMVKGTEFQRRVGTTPFTIVPWQVALTPIKNGAAAVGPINGSVIVYTVPGGRRNRGPFDGFFFGPQEEPHKVELSMDARNLRVLPLPSENVPANFNGAVGNYKMDFTAGPTNIAVGDPITLKVQITGQGHLEGINLPEMGAWRDFKTYPPTTHVEITDKLGINGSKFFEQIVVPQSTDVKELPAFSFSFFDPEKTNYRTLTRPAMPLTVRPGGSAPTPTVVAAGRTSQANSPPPQDIVPIKQRLGAVAQIGPPLIQQPWFLALQGVPLLAWVSALVWRKRVESLANNPRLRRQRQVAKLIAEGLAELRRLAAENKSDEFFAVLSRLLQEQLGERLDVPATAITEAVIEEQLRPRRAPEAVLASLQEIFQICNLARYAPIKTSQELAALIPKLETVLKDLQALKL